MAKRTKKTAPEVEAAGEACDVGTATMLPPEDMAPPDESIPTFEDRLAKLEKLLGEKDQLIMRQASAIAIGVENAERLRKSRVEVDRLEDIAEASKKAATEAKKRYEAAVKAHFELEVELDSPQGRLPFPPPEGEPSAPIAGGKKAGGDDESWRSCAISGLDLPESISDRLVENGLATVGQLADWLKPNAAGYCRKLIDVEGIGQAKAERIEAALDGFWQSRAQLEAEAVNQELLDGVRAVEGSRGIGEDLPPPRDDQMGPDADDWDDVEDDPYGSTIGDDEDLEDDEPEDAA